ncbi:hypothetical protein JCM24511_04095 [Saitozyma sp. JCM 24511]|nr:hypothetical protein JCM24511_04095 [Saitozyma sp. JCM 24511]
MIETLSLLRIAASSLLIIDALLNVPRVLGLSPGPGDDVLAIVNGRTAHVISSAFTSASFFVLVILLVLFTEAFRIGADSGRQSLRTLSNVRDATIGITVFTFLAGLVGSTLRIEALATALPSQPISLHTALRELGTLLMLLDVLGIGASFVETSGQALADVVRQDLEREQPQSAQYPVDVKVPLA